MKPIEIMQKLDSILSAVKTAVLATTGQTGNPHVRWMSPVILAGQPNALYAVTSPHFAKTNQIGGHADVEWMVQSKDLREIINVRGKVNIIDNPALKAEILQSIGDRLNVFWKLSGEATDYVVLETVIEEAIYYLPMKPQKVRVKFA